MRNHCYENYFDLHENETACRTHFHMKGFALRFVLKQKHKRTRKLPILWFYRGAKYRPWIIGNEGDPNFIIIIFLLSASSFSKVRQLNSREKHFCDIILHCYQYSVRFKLVSTCKSVKMSRKVQKKTLLVKIAFRLSAIFRHMIYCQKKQKKKKNEPKNVIFMLWQRY